MKNKKVIIPIVSVLGVGAIVLGVILGLRFCSDKTGDIEGGETSGSVVTDANGETISTGDSEGAVVTDENGTTISVSDNTKDTKESDKTTESSDGSSTSGTTNSSDSGSGSGTGESTNASSGTTKPTENVPPPETEEGEILIIEPTTAAPTNKPNGGGKNPTTSPTGNGGSGNKPTTAPTSGGNGGGTTPAPTSDDNGGVIELPFVPIEDIQAAEE